MDPRDRAKATLLVREAMGSIRGSLHAFLFQELYCSIGPLDNNPNQQPRPYFGSHP